MKRDRHSIPISLICLVIILLLLGIALATDPVSCTGTCR